VRRVCITVIQVLLRFLLVLSAVKASLVYLARLSAPTAPLGRGATSLAWLLLTIAHPVLLVNIMKKTDPSLNPSASIVQPGRGAVLLG